MFKDQIEKNWKLVLSLTLLYPAVQYSLFIARFGTVPSDMVATLAFLLGGFLSSLLYIFVLERSHTKQQKHFLLAGYILSYPLFVLVGIVYGLLVGFLAPLLAVILQAIIVGIFFGIGKLVTKQ